MSHLNKVYKLSAPLQGLLGKSALSRPAAVKEL
jgi:chromatin remodeling complex protein RSC6